VGTYDLTINMGTISNTNVTLNGGTLTITPAPLTVTAMSYTRKQGENNPEFEMIYKGFKLDETEEALTTKPTATCDATVESEPGEYPIMLDGGEAQNYTFTYVHGLLTVEAADPEEPSIGDANGDGVVDVADVVAIVNFILGQPVENFIEAVSDANDDETIDVADVVAVVNIILTQGDATRRETFME
jgi:hypothetical protein